MTEIANTPPTNESMQEFSGPIGLGELDEISSRSATILDHLRNKYRSETRELRRRFSVSEAAEMIGRSAQAIRDAEKQGKLPQPQLTEKGRRAGYTLANVNDMRRAFGTLPYRDSASDEPVILACQSFKGGVGKSTFAVHLSHYLALQGYRVCIIDTDSQATTTMLFGFNPDLDIEHQHTVYPFMDGEADTLHYAIRDTAWDQLKLIPANLSLYELEYTLAAYMAAARDERMEIIMKLNGGIRGIADQFDVVIIDPPPALGLLSLSVQNAANAMIVPTRPSATDFASTAQFFKMLEEMYNRLVEFGRPEPRFKFLKILVNGVDEAKSSHSSITEMMADVYGSTRLNATMKNSAEIDNATARLMSVYELTAPATSREVHRRCKAYLNAINSEIEFLIRKSWPSHKNALRDEGRI